MVYFTPNPTAISRNNGKCTFLGKKKERFLQNFRMPSKPMHFYTFPEKFRIGWIFLKHTFNIPGLRPQFLLGAKRKPGETMRCIAPHASSYPHLKLTLCDKKNRGFLR